MSCRTRPHSRPWMRGCAGGKEISNPEAALNPSHTLRPQLCLPQGWHWRAQLCDWACFQERDHFLGVSAIFFPVSGLLYWIGGQSWASVYSSVGCL